MHIEKPDYLSIAKWSFSGALAGPRSLHQFELDDWGRFGKARQRWEKYLRDPDDVFIQAKERKKQLAKQAEERKKQFAKKRKRTTK